MIAAGRLSRSVGAVSSVRPSDLACLALTRRGEAAVSRVSFPTLASVAAGEPDGADSEPARVCQLQRREVVHADRADSSDTPVPLSRSRSPG